MLKCHSLTALESNAVVSFLRLSEQFGEIFENAHLPTILAQFSPPCTLGDFIKASMYNFNEQVCFIAS